MVRRRESFFPPKLKICCQPYSQIYRLKLSTHTFADMPPTKPQIIVFDLDYTLWPFWVDTHVTPPFRAGSNGKVLDAHGSVVKYYPEVPDVLKKLHEEGFKLAIASRTSEINGANQLIKLFGWEKYFSYKEIFPGCKVTHFHKIKDSSGVSFDSMIFFDDENRNIQDITKLGVLSILVKSGVSSKVVEDGLNKYKDNWS